MRPAPLLLAVLLGAAAVPARAGSDWLIAPPEAEAAVRRDGVELVLENGLVRRTFRLAPDAATVAFDDLRTGASLLRAVRPEAVVVLEGVRFPVGGLVGQPNHAYLTPAWLDAMAADPAGFRCVGYEVGEPGARLAWKRVRHAEDRPWPPPGVALRLDFRLADPAAHPRLADVRVAVHYELYDGVPVLSKWITVTNGGAETVVLEAFTSEVLAVVERESAVEASAMAPPRTLHVETDYAFGGFTVGGTARHTVHWMPDPEYLTQVSYRRLTPCLLEVRPPLGPDQDLAPGATFESFRAFELVHDSECRERRGLALRRMYRTVAPWVTENPIMMHMRDARPDRVRAAIDQCAEVGFEMLILSFGSGFDMEREDPAYLAEMRSLADYARERGVEIGGYSLLSSRRIEPDADNIVNPETGEPGGQTHGFCPALASPWGQRYFAKLRAFLEETGFALLEHDGSWPGDVDAAARPPLQKGLADSQWVQWRILTDFYRWCRARGVYLNVPDYYYLAGSSKCGMGYRETNWSLPREEQHVHARQNIFDGTWEKTPSMGWMFVPLSEYHGGGPAATMEPLSEHLADYDLHMAIAFGCGVQACYRGPRLYDTPAVRDAVAARVAWFERYRDILESDLVHGRRADGRDVDWMLHVNSALEHRGMLVAFNPLDEPVERTLTVDLYYTGIERAALVREGEDGPLVEHRLARDHTVELDVRLGPRGFGWWLVRSGDG